MTGIVDDLEVIDLNDTLNMVVDEVEQALAKFGPFNSMHEGHSIIEEEYLEMWDEIRAKNREAAVAEAVQLAAMAVQFIYQFKSKKDSKNVA